MTFLTKAARFIRIIRDKKGATAIEYALIAGLISVAAITAMTTLGDEIQNTFNTVQGELKDAQKTN